MLLCPSQKNPIKYHGKEIHVSDKALNAHYQLCGLPVDSGSIEVYVSILCGKSGDEAASCMTEEEITKVTERGIRDEANSSAGEDFWESVPC